jgi:hypothetical protein
MKQVSQRRIWEDCVMYKLISIILAAIPFILFVRTIFVGRLRRSQAVSDFRKQIDCLVWIILILIGCGVIYSLGKLTCPRVRCPIFRVERRPVHVTALKKCHVSLISLDGFGALRRCGRDEPTNGSLESLGRRES